MPTIPINVQYYDDQEKQLILSNYPQDFAQIDKRIGIVNVSFEDFQTFSLFRHQTNHSGYSTFKDFLHDAEKYWGENEMYLSLKNGSGNLVCKYPGDVEVKNVPECIGVAGGLSVFSQLYGIHQADWKRIGAKLIKDLDFSRTSSISGRTINVELKGSIVDDNTLKTASISNHRANIRGKKADLNNRAAYNPATDTCLSSITVVSTNDQPVRCWLLDPPSEGNSDVDHEKNRILRRLYFYGEILNWISPKSTLSTALINRIKAIEASSRYTELNGIPLVAGNNKEIEITESFVKSKHHVLTRLLGGRLRLNDDLIAGSVAISRQGNLWFVGLPITAFRMLVDQDFDFILSYRKPSASFPGILRGSLTRKDAEFLSVQLRERLKSNLNRDGLFDRTRFDIENGFILSSSGLVFARIA